MLTKPDRYLPSAFYLFMSLPFFYCLFVGGSIGFFSVRAPWGIRNLCRALEMYWARAWLPRGYAAGGVLYCLMVFQTSDVKELGLKI